MSSKIHLRGSSMLNYWEEFDGTAFIPSSKRLHITLNHKGAFYFNQNAWKEMGQPRAIVFYFNRAESVIGITSAPPDRRNAFPVRPDCNGYGVAATPFLRRYGIKLDAKSTLRFEQPFVDNERVLRLDLRKVTEVSKRFHKPRAKPGAVSR
jgi:hypothetical protein